jgi:hypothetical protein
VTVAAATLPSNTRLSCAGPLKREASVDMAASAGLPMAVTNCLPRKLTALKLRSAMDFGIMVAALMARDANSDMRKEDGKTRPVS